MPSTDTRERRSWRCRLRLHRWQRVTFRDWYLSLVWPVGRRCRDCGRVEDRDAYRFWEHSNLTPNEDTDGYY